ncbi:MAG: DUF4886 domain-containing protein [Clostridia bacterium]|nr:DUF4886 domain-containing protein [Clostridia bacterium]
MRINLRKALALLVSLLMLCTIIPLGAMTSVSAASTVLDINFNDGTTGGFSGGSVVAEGPDGSNCLKWSAGGGYSVTYKSVSGVYRDGSYIITFKAKASVANTMGITIQDGSWANTYYSEKFTTSTEWKEYSIITNVGQTPTSGGVILFKFQDQGVAMDLWVDDLVMAEYEAPTASFDGFLTNGDFEIGTLEGWNVHQSTAISADAAYSGSYGVHLQGNGGWGGMLNQNTVNVVAGNTYTVSMWVKAVANGVNVKLIDGGTDGTNLAAQWFNTTAWTKLEWTVTPTTNIICINFSGAGNSTAESVYVDDILVIEEKNPSDDGYIYNGDFETGKTNPWVVYSSTTVNTASKYEGNFGLNLVGDGGWGGLAYQSIRNLKVGQQYTVTMWMKVVSGGVNVQIKQSTSTASNESWASGYRSTSNTGSWTELTFTFTPTATTGIINLCGDGTGTAADIYVDNVTVGRVGGEIYPEELISYGGSSIKENSDGIGLAFRFLIDAASGQKTSTNEYVENSGKITLDETQYDLVRMGAVMTNRQAVGTTDFTLDDVNGTNVIDIRGQYLAGLTSESVAFAVRIIDIPAAKTGTEIYARPYYVYLENGVEVTVYGDIKSDNYDKVSNPKASIKILSIGSSFSKDVMVTYLYDMFKAGGYDEVVIGYLYMGGCSIVKHLYNAENSLAQYEYGKNSNGTWVQNYDVSSLEALHDEDWDYVTIHGSSDYIGGETISKITLGRDSEGAEVDIDDTTEYEALPKLVDWVKDNVLDASTKIEYHMIWAYSADCDLWSFAYHDYNQMTMYNKIINNTKTSVYWLNDIDGIIPSGTSIQNGRTSLIGDNFNETDGYHLNSKYGDYTAALTWYSFFSGEDASVMAGYTGDLSAEEFEAIAEAVNNAMNKPYAITESTHK